MNNRLHSILPPLLLFLATFALFAPSIGYSLVNLDDFTFISDNPIVYNGFSWASLGHAFTSLHGDEAMYSPLLWVSYLFDSLFFHATPHSPWGYHFTNVLLHASSAVLLYFILRRCACGVLPALIAAAFWSLHPLRVESVAWVTERKDTLSTLFAFASILCYLRAFQSPRPQPSPASPQAPSPRGLPPAGRVGEISKSSLAFPLLSFLFFALGLLSKPMLVTLPFLFLLLDFWPLQRFPLRRAHRAIPRLVLQKWPWFLLTLLFSIATRHLQVDSVTEVPLRLRLCIIPANYLFYLVESFWPSGLMPLANGYLPTPVVDWTAFALFLTLAALAVATFRRSPGVAVGLLAFAGLLFPVSGIVVIGTVPVADRYTYLPAIGLPMALANLLQSFFFPGRRSDERLPDFPLTSTPSLPVPSPRGLPAAGRVGETSSQRTHLHPLPPGRRPGGGDPIPTPPPPPHPSRPHLRWGSRPQARWGRFHSIPASLPPPARAATFLSALVLLLLSAVSLHILPTWKDTKSFPARIAELDPGHFLTITSRFNDTFVEKGPRAALLPARQLFARRGSSPSAVNAMVIVISQLDSSRAALDFFAAHPPTDHEQLSEDLLALDLAILSADVCDFDSALARIDTVLANRYHSARNTELIHSVASWIAFRAGRQELALDFASRVPAAEPGDPFSPVNLLVPCSTVWTLGLYAQALPHLLRLADEDSGNPYLLNNIAWILSTTPGSPANPAEVVSIARRAVELAPDKPVLQDTLAVALAFAGQFDEAAAIEAGLSTSLPPDSSILANIQKRLSLFQSRTPYTENSTSRLLYSPSP